MQFSQITLTGYKNYTQRSFTFNRRIVGICGLNGKGKTNLLDALFYLCFTKSYFSGTDPGNVHFGDEGFRLEGILTGHGEEPQKIVCIYRSGGKKDFFLNEVTYEKFSLHLGKFPCVMIAPDDIQMIVGGSEERRKYLDTLISQIDPGYLQQLITYNKVLTQRNSFLKAEGGKNEPDQALLEVLNEQLIPPAEYIFHSRLQFCEQLFPIIQDFYHSIADNRETIRIIYQSQLKDGDFRTLLSNNWQKDRLLQRTNTGIHKDDLLFNLNDHLFRSIASQGQRKSLLFACKLAQFELLKQKKGFAPILLLDDVFEKLDEKRMRNLLAFVCAHNAGQVFITDTHEERLRHALEDFEDETELLRLT